MNIAMAAMEFACDVHKKQRRKYTGAPYREHLAEVAGIVATVAHELRSCAPPQAIAAAWLHDCVEDQNVMYADLCDRFDEYIADAVMQLSDLEVGNRRTRKFASRARLAKAWPWVQTVKVADLISNTASIVEHDSAFAIVYLEEKHLLLDVLTQAHPELLRIARAQVDVPPE